MGAQILTTEELAYRQSADAETTTLIIVTSMVCWAALYRIFASGLSARIFPHYLRLNPSVRVDWDNRVVSSIHAVITAILSILTFALDTKLFMDPLYRDPATRFVLAHLVGYLCYDAIATIYYRDILPGVKSSLAHHIFGAFSIACSLYEGRGHFFCMYFAVTEVSTPFIHMRWFLDKMGLRTNRRYKFNGLVAFILFFVFRIIPIPFMVDAIVEHWKVIRANFSILLTIVLIGGSAIIFILNLFWFSLLAKGAKKVWFDEKENSVERIRSDSESRRGSRNPSPSSGRDSEPLMKEEREKRFRNDDEPEEDEFDVEQKSHDHPHEDRHESDHQA